MKAFLLSLWLAFLPSSTWAFSTKPISTKTFAGQTTRQQTVSTMMVVTNEDSILEKRDHEMTRRGIFSKAIAASASIATLAFATPAAKAAESAADLDSYLYKIVRVREATQQERRLIQTGKFKDIQRANVKLAVKFMVQNYRLADCVVGASAYLKGGNTAQMKAIDVGQTAVQNLQTILEYFDTSDVENIKVSSSGLGGKEELVLKGLEAAQGKLDEFLGFFDDATVAKIKAKIQEENDLNVKEFDKSLGDIINLPPPS